MTTLAGFKAAFVTLNGVPPTEQQVFDAGVVEGLRRSMEKLHPVVELLPPCDWTHNTKGEAVEVWVGDSKERRVAYYGMRCVDSLIPTFHHDGIVIPNVTHWRYREE